MKNGGFGWVAKWGVWGLGVATSLAMRAAESADRTRLAAEYEREFRPLMAKYCLKCHSTEAHKGDLDLERLRTFSDFFRHSKVLQGMQEQMDLEEMPPKDKPQPSADERKKMHDWIRATLGEIARSDAGDPGPVLLRRLSNAEYTYTVRDLTGVSSLEPAREFPADSASGEGFMNVGQSLVMSPSLVTKYLDAGKEIARHAVLLPDGIRFSPKTSRRDWTEEALASIREFYSTYTEKGGGTAVNLQGIQFDTKDGGVVPLERYLTVLLKQRAGEGPRKGDLGKLSEKYLTTLKRALEGTEPSIVLDPIRARWKTAKEDDVKSLAQDIVRWQQALWKFNTVGHIGKLRGPTSWMEAISPVRESQELRMKLSPVAGAREMSLFLAVTDAGDGGAGDDAVWERPRLVATGRPDLLLRDLRAVAAHRGALRDRVIASAEKVLGALGPALGGAENLDVSALAARSGVDAEVLQCWVEYLGLGESGSARVVGHFTEKIPSLAGYDFVKGWGPAGTPNFVANSSAQHVRIPGNLKGGGVAMHPSPTMAAAAGWQSPVSGSVRVVASIQHAHPECGNGVTWAVELRRGNLRRRLSSGVSQGGRVVQAPVVESLSIRSGDVVCLVIGPRDGNHSCDLTAVDLSISETKVGGRVWDLAKEVSPDVLAGNPHADAFGNAGVWHFFIEPDKGGALAPVVPAGSALARWQEAGSAEERSRAAGEVAALLRGGVVESASSPDGLLFRQLTSLGGPLLGKSLPADGAVVAGGTEYGLDRATFGKHPQSGVGGVDSASLCLQAPQWVEVRVPADLAEGYEFVATGRLHATTGREGSVQFQVLTNRPGALSGALASAASSKGGRSAWTDPDQPVSHATSIVVNSGTEARRRVDRALDEFRSVFPAALCYTKIVPVDEVVTLTLYYREDDALKRLLLSDSEASRLDRLWDELHYVSHDALTLVDAYEQLWQYATQDADPKVFEPMREPILRRAAEFRQRLKATEPRHLDAVLRFAGDAYRRPLRENEAAELRGLYGKLREQELNHEDAIRLTLARAMVSPEFLYRVENPGPGVESTPVGAWELASRMSYFLWSSSPDAALRKSALEGRLTSAAGRVDEGRRMMRDERVSRLAREFACVWLHVYEFDQLGEKSERHYPTFNALRGAMYEETIRFFTEFFQRDGSILELLDADHAILNEELAKHYGIPGVSGAEWRRVDGVRQYGRGGILTLATTLAKQSGASRTSPILRGNWVAEVLLGDKLPRPPKDVPRLPEEEPSENLTMRQLVEKHSSDPKCYGCHQRIDPYGYALEGYDGIGRRRAMASDTRVQLMDGAEFEGVDGLRKYLGVRRRDAFVKQFCRKLLGYALGRGVMLSDGPLLSEMATKLASNNYRISVAVEAILASRQFSEIRGKDRVDEP